MHPAGSQCPQIRMSFKCFFCFVLFLRLIETYIGLYMTVIVWRWRQELHNANTIDFMTPARRLAPSFIWLAAGHFLLYIFFFLSQSPIFLQWLPSLSCLNIQMSERVWKAVVHLNGLFNNCFTLLFVCFKIKPCQRKIKPWWKAGQQLGKKGQTFSY